MSRPRKPYGNPPGRLAATMLKVLAAELSDGGRLGRGKQLWADSAVIDIVVGHGAVTAEVQGSRSQPYVVTLEAEPGSGTPRRADLWIQCTCPDDSGRGDEACKHAVAALFALSDEVAVEPALLERWRAGRRRRAAVADPAEPLPDNVRRLRLVRDTDDSIDADDLDDTDSVPIPPAVISAAFAAPVVDPSVAQMAAMLAGPGGVPPFPAPTDREHPLPGRQPWADVLGSALAELKRVRWD